MNRTATTATALYRASVVRTTTKTLATHVYYYADATGDQLAAIHYGPNGATATIDTTGQTFADASFETVRLLVTDALSQNGYAMHK